MVIAAIPSQTSVQIQSHSCEWISNIFRKVHDFAMRIFESICIFFKNNPSSISGTTSLSNGGMSVERLHEANLGVQTPALTLISFYRGSEPNNNGVTLDQILSWDDARLESMHNYIQWLFPLKKRSNPNPIAPCLDNATIRKFQGDAMLKNQVLRSFRRMLTFYGLQMDEVTKVITRASNFNGRSAVWLTDSLGHHNFLRITRIIHSMDLLGLPDYSRSFFLIMQDIERNEGQGYISDETLGIWQRACLRN